MRRERVLLIWSGGSLSGCVLAATVWAQAPAPPQPAPVCATGPAPVVMQPREGPIKRSAHHIGRALQDNMIGYPQEFVEPPPGYYLNEMFGTMKAKANTHRFTLYRSDFLEGTDKLSPSGAARFNLMATRVNAWLGPITIEWSPEQPGLAEMRRAAVLAIFQGGGFPMIPERVVIGPSPYPGLLGTDAQNNYANMIQRDQAAPQSYSLTPTTTGSGGAGGGNGP